MTNHDIINNFKIKEKTKNSGLLSELPFDQYLCPECKEIPEIVNIDYDNDYLISYMCKNNSQYKQIPIIDYFKNESNFLYINEVCGKDKKEKQINYKKCLFDYCPGCNIFLCGACSMDHKHQNNFIKINEMNYICQKHLQKYNKYCLDCQKHLCNKDDDSNCKGHKMEYLEGPREKDIQTLLQERERLLKDKELLDHLIKLINTILQTFIYHPNNFLHITNINNMAEIIIANNRNRLNRQLLYSKVNHLEKVLLYYLNCKFKLELNGDEKIVDLSDKNLQDFDFEVLSEINFKNAETFSLKNNEISNIQPIAKFKSKNVKELDLSFNNIHNLNPMKDYAKNEQKIETIYFTNNKIDNVEVLKNLIFKNLKNIELDKNNLAIKEIQEIKDILKGKKPKLKYILKPKKNDVDPNQKYTIVNVKEKNRYDGIFPMGKLPPISHNNYLIRSDIIRNNRYSSQKQIIINKDV